MVAQTRKQLVYVPELRSPAKAEPVNAAQTKGAQAPVVENSRPPFLIYFAYEATQRWFAGWMSSRLY